MNVMSGALFRSVFAICIWVLTLCQESTKFPSSFAPPGLPSLLTKTLSAAAGDSSTTEDNEERQAAIIDYVSAVLSTFEIDTHIEIVLIGDVFDQTIVNSLSVTLDILPAISSKYTPMHYVHEKLIYHISLGNIVGNDVQKYFQNARNGSKNNTVIDADNIAKVLSGFHKNSASSTTLFIMHLDTSKYGEYSYASGLQKTSGLHCSRRSFISSEGFAWLDITATASLMLPYTSSTNDIERNIDIIPVPDLKNILTSKSNRVNDMYELASLIHRSGESLIPFPSTTKNHKYLPLLHDVLSDDIRIGKNNPTVAVRTRIVVLIVTICAENSISSICEDDESTQMSVAELIKTHSDSSPLTMTTLKYNIHNEPQLLHAFQSSIRFSAFIQNMYTLNPSDFLYWIGSTSIVKDAISRLNEDYTKVNELTGQPSMNTRILPIFVMKVSKGTDVYMDKYETMKVLPFAEPPGGWGVSKFDEKHPDSIQANSIASQMVWPNVAIISIRSSSNKQYKSASGIQCDGIPLPSDDAFLNDKLYAMLIEAIWDIPQLHTHYSSSSRNLINDFLWITPAALRIKKSFDNEHGNINMHDSFREKRIVTRSLLMTRLDNLIIDFVNSIKLLKHVDPPVDIVSLLSLEMLLPNKFDVKASNIAAKKIGQKETSNNLSKENLFEELLAALDVASKDISHLDFEDAYLNVYNAEIKVLKVKGKLDGLLYSRRGIVHCDSLDGAPVKLEYKERDNSRNYASMFLIIVGILAGAYNGYVGVASGIL